MAIPMPRPEQAGVQVHKLYLKVKADRKGNEVREKVERALRAAGLDARLVTLLD